MSTLPPLILASTSTFRQMSLQRLGLDFCVRDPQITERRQANEEPLAMALRLAAAKAQAVARHEPAAVVISGDQVLDVAGQDYGKPGNAGDARAQLRALSGHQGVFHCGTCVIHGARKWLFAIPTAVTWRELSDAQINAYIEREPAFDSAGAAQLEGLGIALVKKITSDDPSAILGVPLIAISGILNEIGFALP